MERDWWRESVETASMLGPYSVGDWIGGRFQVFDVHEGGMSLVYVVNDQMNGPGPQVVALKTLRGELLRSRIRIGRFAAECRLWVQLGDHPNIVRAHSVEVIDGRPYVVLELVQGGDLNRWIGTPRLDPARALRFSYQFCLGMEHALRQGLHCHRDIKPGNLLVTEDGTLKITDFGLARISEEMVAVRSELPDGSIPLAETGVSQPIVWTDPRDWDGIGPARQVKAAPLSRATATPPSMRVRTEQAPLHRLSSTEPIALWQDPSQRSVSQSPTTIEKETSEYVSPLETADPRLTRTGARLGTGAYMSPEQFRDPRSVDVRADIYAFGVVLFEMITGSLPFKGRSMDALNHQHSLHQPPSIVASVPSRHAKLAKGIDAIVQRCLKKDPAERFRSVADLRRSLKPILAQLPRR
jgi:serine/threonine protein kinase